MFITVEVWENNEKMEWLEYDAELGNIDLTKEATATMVDMLLTSLIAYNHIDGRHKEFILNNMIKEMRKKELIVLGGIHFQEDSKHIYNGCCCGMEMWSEIADTLKEHRSPWMGHDPEVCCSERDGIFYVSDVQLINAGKIVYCTNADGEIYSYEPGISIEEALENEKYTVISYEEDIFLKLLEKLDEDFNDFVEYPLKKRLIQLTSEKLATEFLEESSRVIQYIR